MSFNDRMFQIPFQIGNPALENVMINEHLRILTPEYNRTTAILNTRGISPELRSITRKEQNEVGNKIRQLHLRQHNLGYR